MTWLLALLARWGFIPYHGPLIANDTGERELQRRLDALDATVRAQHAQHDRERHRREREARHVHH